MATIHRRDCGERIPRIRDESLRVESPCDRSYEFHESGITEWTVAPSNHQPKNIVVDDNGYLWIAQADENFENFVIRKYSKTGVYQNIEIQDPFNGPGQNWDIDDLAIDNSGRLLVADAGYSQQILRYSNLGTVPTKDSWTLGEFRGTIAGPVPGKAEPKKFNSPTGVGADQYGNIYVGANGSNQYGGTQGAQLKKFGSGGAHKWTIDGLIYWDAGTPDPQDLSTVYTKFLKFDLDYSKPDQEGLVHPSWSQESWTLNASSYPDDPRAADHTLELNLEEVTTPQLVRIGGEKFLVTAKNSAVVFMRFDGEIAVPCLMFGRPHVQYNYNEDYNTIWPANNPYDPSVYGSAVEWIWKDGSGPNGVIDGQIDANEFSITDTKALQWASHIDKTGSIWFGGANAGGKLRISLFEINATNPVVNGIPNYGPRQNWDFAESQYHGDLGLSVIEDFGLHYDSDNDRMYIAGYSADHPLQNPPASGTKPALSSVQGIREIRRYDNWLASHRDNDPNTWPTLDPNLIIVPPYDGIPRDRRDQIRGQAWDIAGDYLFLRYDMNAFVGGARGEILVYRRDDSSYVGVLQAKNFVENMANDGGIQAFKRADGAYLIFMTALPNGVGAYHEWFPNGPPSPTPEGLYKIVSVSDNRLVLGTTGGGNGSSVILATDSGSPNQQWTVGDAWGDSYFRFVNLGYDKTLENYTNNVNIYDNSEKNWKKFTLYDQGNGVYSMECLHTGLTVTTTGFFAGANVHAATYTGDVNQQWRFIPIEDGSGNSQLYLEDFADGETFTQISPTTVNGDAAGALTAPSSGNVVAKDVLANAIDINGLSQLSASMKIQVPTNITGSLDVRMIARVTLEGGGSAFADGPTIQLDSSMEGQFGTYQGSIPLPQGADTISEVRIRLIQGTGGSPTQTILFDDITLSE